MTVRGVQDDDANDEDVVVDLSAAGGGYNSRSAEVAVEVDDNDTAGLDLNRSVVPVNEGDTATFTVKLATKPSAMVTVGSRNSPQRFGGVGDFGVVFDVHHVELEHGADRDRRRCGRRRRGRRDRGGGSVGGGRRLRHCYCDRPCGCR